MKIYSRNDVNKEYSGNSENIYIYILSKHALGIKIKSYVVIQDMILPCNKTIFIQISSAIKP